MELAKVNGEHVLIVEEAGGKVRVVGAKVDLVKGGRKVYYVPGKQKMFKSALIKERMRIESELEGSWVKGRFKFIPMQWAKLQNDTSFDEKYLLDRCNEYKFDVEQVRAEKFEIPKENEPVNEQNENLRRSARKKSMANFEVVITPLQRKRKRYVNSEQKFTPVDRVTRSVKVQYSVNSESSISSQISEPSSSSGSYAPIRRSTRKPSLLASLDTPTIATKASKKRSRKEQDSPLKKKAKVPRGKSPVGKSVKAKERSYEEVRASLHVSNEPDSLIGRDKEFDEIHDRLSDALDSKNIAGVPGTGKTANVTKVIRQLQEEYDFTYVYMNGMCVTDPQATFVYLYKIMCGKKAGVMQAYELLTKYISSSRKMILLVVDELDLLVNAKQNVIYNLFDWSNKHKLIIASISNTIDLPEKLKNKISSRLGLTRINFLPYTFKQLIDILKDRIGETKVIEDSAIELCSRKVSSVSGDARRALDICRRAVEVGESTNSIVKTSTVLTAIQEMYNHNKGIIAALPFYQKVFLIAVLRLKEQKEFSLKRIRAVVKEMSTFRNFKNLNENQFLGVFHQLCAMSIIIANDADLYRKVKLNVNETELQMLLSEDEKVGTWI